MLRADRLIREVRDNTDNSDFTDTSGIPDSKILRYLNDGQDALQSEILKAHPQVFYREIVFNVVAGQQAYDTPFDAHLGNRIVLVEYSPSGQDLDYYKVDYKPFSERKVSYKSTPMEYTIRTGQILLYPIPQTSGKLRVNYDYAVRRLDKRRGLVASATLAGNTISTLFLSTSDITQIDSTPLLDAQYACIVDAYGNFLMKNIPVTAIDTSTGSVTVATGFTFQTGETIPSGSYIVSGKNTSSHSEYPEHVERFLLAYAEWKVFKRDSSSDSQEAEAELMAQAKDIAESYGLVIDDVILVPWINRDLL
jgi:hypothetical protein